MGKPLKIDDITSLIDLKAALSRFRTSVQEAIAASSKEIRDGVDWIEDIVSKYNADTEQARGRLYRAEQALQKCKRFIYRLPNGQLIPRDCRFEESELSYARDELARAVERQKKAEAWRNRINAQASSFERDANRSRSFLDKHTNEAQRFLSEIYSRYQTVYITPPQIHKMNSTFAAEDQALYSSNPPRNLDDQAADRILFQSDTLKEEFSIERKNSTPGLIAQSSGFPANAIISDTLSDSFEKTPEYFLGGNSSYRARWLDGFTGLAVLMNHEWEKAGVKDRILPQKLMQESVSIQNFKEETEQICNIFASAVDRYGFILHPSLNRDGNIPFLLGTIIEGLSKGHLILIGPYQIPEDNYTFIETGSSESSDFLIAELTIKQVVFYRPSLSDCDRAQSKKVPFSIKSIDPASQKVFGFYISIKDAIE